MNLAHAPIPTTSARSSHRAAARDPWGLGYQPKSITESTKASAESWLNKNHHLLAAPIDTTATLVVNWPVVPNRHQP